MPLISVLILFFPVVVIEKIKQLNSKWTKIQCDIYFDSFDYFYFWNLQTSNMKTM